MEEFRAGYRSVLAAVDIGCHMGVKGPYLKPFQEGWGAGIDAGKKDHPEKAAEMLGRPLRDYLRALREVEK